MRFMPSIPGVKVYVQSADAADRLAEKLPPEALLVGGRRALAKALPLLEGPLGGKKKEVFVFDGPPCEETISLIRERAREASCLVGIGGGRAIDAAKTAAAKEGLPFYTLPTSAATCAPTTRLYVNYKADGRRGLRDNEWSMEAPFEGCYADTRLLADCPDRYLASGVADGFAKLSEAWCAELIDHKRNPLWRANVALSDELTQILYDYSPAAFAGDTEAKEALWYANLCLTGQLSSMGTGRWGYVLAHAVYDSYCDVDPVARAPFLHGEIVGVGVLKLLRYLVVPGMPLDKTEALFRDVLKVPLTLKDVGIKTAATRKALYENLLARRRIDPKSPLAQNIALALEEGE